MGAMRSTLGIYILEDGDTLPYESNNVVEEEDNDQNAL